MKSCFFIGHREASTEVLPALLEAVEQHIVEYGVTEFIVGNYGGFDHMAAKAVIAAKKAASGDCSIHADPLPPSGAANQTSARI